MVDAFALEPSHAFDVAFFGFFLSHVPRDRFEAFWALLEGVLAPSGRVFFVDEGRHHLWREDWLDETARHREPSARSTAASTARSRSSGIRPTSRRRLTGLGWDASVTGRRAVLLGPRPKIVASATIGGYDGTMPAITVDDISVLPRIGAPDPAVARERAVISLTSAPRGFEGEGFPVRRAFHGVDMAHLDPFIHMDQMGEVEYAPGEPKGTPWHPHRGFETVTYMMDGTFEHADSNGGGGVITNGDTQWMTAGAGILHIEKPPEALVVSGGLFHGIQLWVNLPKAQKWSPPRYQDIRAGEVGLLASADGGALVRVIAGELAGHTGPGSTYTPMTLRARHPQPRGRAGPTLARRLQRPGLRPRRARNGRRRADRRSRPGSSPSSARATRSASGAAERQESRSPNLDVLVLGGRPIREPVAWAGPFVMNTRDEVMQAFADYQAGRLGSIPAVHGAPTTLTESSGSLPAR